MLNFIKKYWFMGIIVLFIFLYLIVFLSVVFSPKEDKFDRGFIRCTKEMATQIVNNKNQSSFNLVSIIIENTYCDVKVMLKGFSNWIDGEQEYPWSNYFYEPMVEEKVEIQDEELSKFYEENPEILKDMETLNLKRQELEQRLLEKEFDEENAIVEPFDVELIEQEETEDKEQRDESKEQKSDE